MKKKQIAIWGCTAIVSLLFILGFQFGELYQISFKETAENKPIVVLKTGGIPIYWNDNFISAVLFDKKGIERLKQNPNVLSIDSNKKSDLSLTDKKAP